MQTTYNLVSEALDPIREWAETLDFGGTQRNDYANGPFDRITNLRLDAECLVDGRTKEQSIWLAFTQFRDELMDLVTNGDVSHSSDALLKFIDGEVKRGKRLSKIHFPRASIYREYRPVHSSYEYTLFLVLYAEFE